MIKTVNSINREKMIELLEKFNLSTCYKTLKEQHKLIITKKNNEYYSTKDTRNEDQIWWTENRHSLKAKFWRESNEFIWCFTDYGVSEEIAVFKNVLRYYKGSTVDTLLNQLKNSIDK